MKQRPEEEEEDAGTKGGDEDHESVFSLLFPSQSQATSTSRPCISPVDSHSLHFCLSLFPPFALRLSISRVFSNWPDFPPLRPSHSDRQAERRASLRVQPWHQIPADTQVYLPQGNDLKPPFVPSAPNGASHRVCARSDKSDSTKGFSVFSLAPDKYSHIHSTVGEMRGDMPEKLGRVN